MKKRKQTKQEMQKEIASFMSNLILNVEMNGLAMEYYIYFRLKPNDEIPVTLFLNLLKYEGQREKLDLEATYISGEHCLNKIDYNTAAQDFFSGEIYLILSHAFPKCKMDKEGHYLYPESVLSYNKSLFELFKKIVSLSCELDCYEPAPRLSRNEDFNKSLANTVADNPTRRIEPSFIFDLLSQVHFTAEEFNGRFYTQLKIMKEKNELSI